MPVTAPAPRRRGLAAALAALLAAGGLAWWRPWAVPPAEAPAGSTASGRSAGDTSLVSHAAAGLVEVPDPLAPRTGALPADVVRAALAHPFEFRRVGMLKALVEQGCASREIAADLERLRGSGSPVERAWAAAAVMRVMGTRDHVRDLAEAAASHEASTPMLEALVAFDPVAGRATVVAFREARSRAAHPGAAAIPGLAAAIDALVADPAAGAAAVVSGAAAATGPDFEVWLRVTQALRPVPSDALTSAAARLAGPAGPDRLAALTFLAQPGTDLSAAGPPVADALLRALEAPRKPGQPLDTAALRALGRLPRLEPRALDRLMTLARAGPEDLRSVLGAVAAAGPVASGAAPLLLSMAPGVPDALRPWLAEALAATGAPAAEAYALERLRVAGPAERAAWIRRLGPSKEPAAIVSVLGEELSAGAVSEAAHAVEALSRVDPGLADAATANLLVRALGDARAPVRAAAISSVGRLTVATSALADALGPSLDAPPGPERAAATAVVLDAARLGPAAAPFVPALLRLATQSDAAADPLVRERAVHALAAVDPGHPGARLAFRAVLLAPGGENARRAALWGLSRLAVPAPEDRDAVRAARSDPVLADAAAEVLSRPAWR